MRGKLSVVNVSCWWMFVTRWTPFFSLDVNLSSLSSPLGVVLLNNVLTWHWNNSEINWVLQDGLIHVLFMYANQCGMGESWLRYHACTKPSIISVKFAKHEDAVHFGLKMFMTVIFKSLQLVCSKKTRAISVQLYPYYQLSCQETGQWCVHEE